MNEKSIVIQQISNISKYFFKYDSLIQRSNNINCKNNKIGNIVKFNFLNYISFFDELVTNQKYHIILNDGSIICFYYEFNQEGSIIKHCLYYLPCPSEKVEMEFKLNGYNHVDEIEPNILLLLSELLEKYIRIDYSLEGKKDYVHTNVHLHYGYTDNKLRFPLYSKVYPEEFLYFILKYVYLSDDDRLENLNLGENKNIELSDLELKRFFLNNKLDS